MMYLGSPFDYKKDSRSRRLINFFESKNEKIQTFFFNRKHKNALLNRMDMYTSFYKWLKLENIKKNSKIITGNAEYTIIARVYSLINNKALNIIGDIHDNHAYIFTGIASTLYYAIESIALLTSNAIILPSLRRKVQYPKILTVLLEEKFIEISNSGLTPIQPATPNNTKKDNSEIKIIYAGSIDYGRMIEDLLELEKKFHFISVEIYGDGPLLKNSPQIFNSHYKGKFSFSQLSKIYNDADYIFACYSASVKNNKLAQPNKLREVFEYNKPIITNTGTLFSEAAIEYKCGLVVDFKNKNQLIEKIKEYIQHPFNPNTKLFNNEILANIRNAEKILEK